MYWFLKLQFGSNTSHFCEHFIGQSMLNGFKRVEKNNSPTGRELALGEQQYDLFQQPSRAKGDVLGPESLWNTADSSL